jgi:23S rRNA pseudouridine1911/1915/1917 synthase
VPGPDEEQAFEPDIVAITDELSGERVDHALSMLTGLSRSRIHHLIGHSAIELEGKPVKKSRLVESGERYFIHAVVAPTSELEVVATEDPTVLYSDDDIIVVDKPVGYTVHPAPSWEGPDIISWLQEEGFQLPGLGVEERPGVVHRLDVGTSGVMVVAASDRAYSALKRAFRNREVDKVYHALVQGYPSPSSGTIDAPIGRHPSSSWKFAVVREGRHSITHYDTVEVFPGATLVEVHLETGRTHQIRVHFQAERHPLVGDALYGADPVFAKKLQLERQWLHAVSLGFTHPGTGEYVSFRSEYPEDLAKALQLLEAQ